ncbi:MAG: rod shape-determining protein [Bacteroidales bacterium]|nr:rod shape-determining protein [Bacteroidales bacterium]
MILASIDIGSNAVRLLFANAYLSEGRTHVEKATLVRIPVRLGMDVFKDNFISKERSKMLIKTLKAFKLLIDVYKPVAYTAYATAAMREAKNNKAIIKKIKKETGIEVKIIDGIEEANIIKEMNNVITESNSKYNMYIDVGGGSTDISILEKKRIISSASFNIGTIRLLEEKVEKKEWERLEKFLKGLSVYSNNIYCIGTGGNINKIAKMFADPLKNTILFSELAEIYNNLDKLSVSERMIRYGLREDRADVIVPAARIYLEILKTTGIEKINVPRIGLADGLIYKMFKEMKNE